VCTSGASAQSACITARGPLKRLLAAALALAACGFGPLSAVGIALGWVGRGRLKRVPHATQGLRWANVAIVVGLLNSALWLLAWGWFTRPPPTETAVTAALMPFATHAAARPSEIPDFPEIETLPETSRAPLEAAKSARQPLEASQGAFFDIPDSVESLGASLEEQARRATARGLTPVVLLVADDCPTCAWLERRLTRPELRHTRSRIALIRVNVTTFESELEALRIPTERSPAFVRISDRGAPLDFIGESEWGTTPASLAKTLESFLGGEARTRVEPWRGGARPDETPI
jgi:hypothetical protein